VDGRWLVRVQRFVEGRSARLGPHYQDACLSQGMSSRCCGLVVMVVVVLNHSSFHHKLDEVERNELNDVLPKTHQNKSRKRIGDLPKPK